MTWGGRVDADPAGFTGRWHEIVRPWTGSERGGVGLLGFASDAGVRRNHGRPGAVDGPSALRRALSPLTLPGPVPLYDAGDVTVDGDALEAGQTTYAGHLAALLRHGVRPIGLGGGHEIAWATWQGLVAGRAPARALVVNLDAHLDLRPGPATSGTPFRQIADDAAARGIDLHYAALGISRHANTPALFARAEAIGATVVHDLDLAPTLPAVLATLDRLAEGRAVYLTVCLDVLPAATAPGVSAPAGYGVDLPTILTIVRHLAPRLTVADVAELCPPHDEAGRTARVAARIVAEIAQPVWGDR